MIWEYKQNNNSMVDNSTHNIKLPGPGVLARYTIVLSCLPYKYYSLIFFSCFNYLYT